MGDASRKANLAAIGNWTKDGHYREAPPLTGRTLAQYAMSTLKRSYAERSSAAAMHSMSARQLA